jgi:hypothetical protein
MEYEIIIDEANADELRRLPFTDVFLKAVFNRLYILVNTYLIKVITIFTIVYLQISPIQYLENK